MLKRILFYLVPANTTSNDLRMLLVALKNAGIESAVCDSSELPPSFPAAPSAATTSYADCLLLTDSANGIAFAQSVKAPCIGYSPAGSNENLSGAYALFEDFSSIDVGYLCRTHAHAMGYPAHILSTKRLIIREFSESEFPALYTMCTEPSTASFMKETLCDYATEQEKHKAYIRNIYPLFDLALWGVFEKSSGKLIGKAGFSLPEHSAELFSVGYLIDVPNRGCGYAKELLPALLSYAKEQGYPEISAKIKPDNAASLKVLEHCGFPYERIEDTETAIQHYRIYLPHP